MKKYLRLCFIAMACVSFMSCKTGTKVASTCVITDRYWKLTELNGSALGDTETVPNITLHSKDSRLSGSAGCNRLLGQYELTGSAGISFGNVGSTRMLCRDMSVEDAVLKMMGNVDSYECNGDVLCLKHDGKVLARFVSVLMQ